MSFLMRLVGLLPLQYMMVGQDENIPVGFDRVITSRGNFVVTARNSFVIAKAY